MSDVMKRAYDDSAVELAEFLAGFGSRKERANV